jgi:hypothetical protein
MRRQQVIKGKKVYELCKIIRVAYLMLLACHKKSYLICVEFRIFEKLRNIYFDFFQCTKMRQPTGQRQLPENK